MAVNVKKPISLKNRTKYFNPDKDKVKVIFSSPYSYRARQQKIEGYETRLYWQFRYGEEHDGQTFFYTLTYNDASIPRHYGFPCFDYEDLRDLLTGGFRKILLRKYGSIFKYFISAELGDGKGDRGFHNNPHYHCLFFVLPDPDKKFPYRKITPIEFRHLVRLYWQGFDQDLKRIPFINALHGIAKEGLNCGKVTDFRACCYCAKYVCKDAGLVANEASVEKILRASLKDKFYLSDEVAHDFFKSFIFERFNVSDGLEKSQWKYSERELLFRLLPDNYKNSYGLEIAQADLSFLSWSKFVGCICSLYNLRSYFDDFVRVRLDNAVHVGLTEYRNRYCNKVRISQGVGDYALDFVDDYLNPMIQVPSKSGFKNRPLSLYYFRKLFTEVVRPIENKLTPMEKPSFFSSIRILNQDGINYKVEKLKKSFERLSSDAKNNLQLLINDPSLFEKMVVSDVNTEVTFSYDTFLSLIGPSWRRDLTNISNTYAFYKLVYENRYFKIKDYGNSRFGDFPSIDVYEDYKRFITPSYFSTSRSDVALDSFLECYGKDYLPYKSHPYFLRYICLYALLDLCADYFFVQGDNEAQRKAEEVAAVARFHKKLEVQSLFNNLF